MNHTHNVRRTPCSPRSDDVCNKHADHAGTTNPARVQPRAQTLNHRVSSFRSPISGTRGANVANVEALKGPRLSSLRTSTTQCVVIISTALVLLGSVGGCTNTRQRDFYAARNIDISPEPGDGTVIVRRDTVDLLTRERQALALSRVD